MTRRPSYWVWVWFAILIFLAMVASIGLIPWLFGIKDAYNI